MTIDYPGNVSTAYNFFYLKVTIIQNYLFTEARSSVCLLYTSPSPRDISGSRQAQDATRDPEMSRGLGDVYKRQPESGAVLLLHSTLVKPSLFADA
ncbi:hypothetical protein ACX3V1_12360 [Escherichia coli]